MERWYVVSTQPNAEAKAVRHLDQQGFRPYLPRRRKRRSHARRVDWVVAPLFPRYLFVRFDIETTRWRAINSTVGVSHLICTGGLPRPVPEGIVKAIRARESDDGLIEIIPRFKKGEPVVVGEGPFLDQIGLFDQIDDSMRVVILLSLLGREVKVRIPTYAVRAAA
jgi:transcriptional antiterminator RfaH